MLTPDKGITLRTALLIAKHRHNGAAEAHALVIKEMFGTAAEQRLFDFQTQLWEEYIAAGEALRAYCHNLLSPVPE